MQVRLAITLLCNKDGTRRTLPSMNCHDIVNRSPIFIWKYLNIQLLNKCRRKWELNAWARVGGHPNQQTTLLQQQIMNHHLWIGKRDNFWIIVCVVDYVNGLYLLMSRVGTYLALLTKCFWIVLCVAILLPHTHLRKNREYSKNYLFWTFVNVFRPMGPKEI